VRGHNGVYTTTPLQRISLHRIVLYTGIIYDIMGRCRLKALLRRAALLCLVTAGPHAPSADAAVSCGAGTSYEPSAGVCTANCSSASQNTGHVYLAGMFDLAPTVHYASYFKHHFALAVDLINNHSDGLWDDVLTGAKIETNLVDTQCLERKGFPAYWSMREWGQPLHGVIGCRCSGASMAVANIAQLDQVPQISSASTSPRLSNTLDFPYFYRTVTPDGPKGGAGAVVQLMRAFGWERVMVLHTDKPWAYDMATQFRRLWVGEHSGNVNTNTTAWTGQIPYFRSVDFRTQCFLLMLRFMHLNIDLANCGRL
jgi:hypothetical protein